MGAEMKVFVVNLKRRKDRKEQIIAQLPAYFETYFTSDWEGPMDGRYLTTQMLNEHGFSVFPWEIESENRWWSRPINSGEIGCAVSHWLSWQKASSLDDPHYVFMEDDVHLGPSFGRDLPGIVSRLAVLDEAWDLLYLGRCPQEQEADRQRIGEFLNPGFSYGTHAYMLSRHGIDQVLATEFSKDLIPVDEFLPAMYVDHPRADVRNRYQKRLRAYSVAPLICSVEHSFGSDIMNSDFIS
jgi:glycosyl transferase, family 25